MIVGGYRLKGYDATYEKTTFDITSRVIDSKTCVLEIFEHNSGVTFIVMLNSEDEFCRRFNKKTKRKNHKKYS